MKELIKEMGGRDMRVLGVMEWLELNVKGEFDEVTGAIIRGYFEAGNRVFSLHDEGTKRVLKKIGWDGSERKKLEGYVIKLVGYV